MKNFVTYILCFVIFSLIHSDQCQKCDVFDDIEVMVIPDSKNPHRKIFPTVDGCFEPTQFKTKVDSIVVNREYIGTLGDRAVHDLLQLKSLSFYSFNIRKISSHAFENLPKLQKIWITNSKLTSIPSGTFKNMTSLEIIDLQGGKISEIANDVFDVGLRKLSLIDNELLEIDHRWFSNSQDVDSLLFSFNKIQGISENTFQYTPKLKTLFLSFNEIRHIEEKAFHHLKNMEILDLGYNRIVELDPNIVPDNFKVGTLNLKCNFLNFISQSFLDKIKVETIVLSGNPWECACLEQTHHWMINSNVKAKNECKLFGVPHCVYGKHANVCSDQVNTNITSSFLQEMRNLNNSKIDKTCANLS